VYAVACDGALIGLMWPGAEGHILGGWTCAPDTTAPRLGPFRTARVAAAALAERCNVRPQHTLPALGEDSSPA
jgi:hypothetical protein